MLSSVYIICLCSYFAIVFMAMLDRFSVIFKCRKTAWWSFAIVLMGKPMIVINIAVSLSLESVSDASCYVSSYSACLPSTQTAVGVVEHNRK